MRKVRSTLNIVLVYDFFLFIPARYHDFDYFQNADGFERLAYLISPISHGFLHGSPLHLISNIGFLMAFGSGISKILSPARFLILLSLSIAGGAFCYGLLYPFSQIPLIGISAGISGLLGASLRPLILPFAHAPSYPIISVFTNQRQAILMALSFILLNLMLYFFEGVDEDVGNIAWHAHIGGFITGFISFSFLYRPHSRF